MKSKPAIVILGAGNLAVQLANAFLDTKKASVYVYNRTRNSALKALAKAGAYTCTQLNVLPDEATVYFLCVSDSAIASMAKKTILHVRRGIICHCSGSTPLQVLHTSRLPYGVLYPLQTFSGKRKLNWKEIPFLLEGNNSRTLQNLKTVARLLSNEIHVADSEKRLQFHLAAVLVNNFVNALYLSASDMLGPKQFALLQPLASETVNKAFALGPEHAQTGPAKRGDSLTLKRHRQLLAKDKRLLQLYKEFSDYISNYFSNPSKP